MKDVSLDSLVVYCADIGSVKRDKFGWASRCIGPDPRESRCNDIQQLVKHVACDLNSGRKVALGFECPLWVPVALRSYGVDFCPVGDGNRSWSAAAGATSLATGLTETTWILSEIHSEAQNIEAFLDWPRFAAVEHGLFLWEAMVTGDNRTGSHEGDAAAAVCAFIKALPAPTTCNAVTSPHKVRSLIGAALLWAGWSDDLNFLKNRCVVISPTSRDASG